MRKIIGISGLQGSGKTTLSKLLEIGLKASFPESEVHRVRFAHYIYEMHDSIRSILKEEEDGLKRMGINYNFSKKDGPLLQYLGTEFGRGIDENIWAALTAVKIGKIFDEAPEHVNSFALLEDMRFENEFDIFPSSLKIRLICDEEVRKERCEMWRDNTNHPSETGLDAYSKDGKFDMYFSTEVVSPDLIVDDIIKKLKEG